MRKDYFLKLEHHNNKIYNNNINPNLLNSGYYK